MPTYLYRCNNEKCNKTFEVVGSFDFLLTHRPTCPDCKGNDISRRFTTPEIIFKGKGFYVNDKKEQ